MKKLFFSYHRPNQTEIQRSKLKKDCVYLLERLGLPYEHVQGNFGGNLEDSFLVKQCSGTDIYHIKKACRDYLKQDSVLIINSYGGAALHTLADNQVELLGELKTIANDNRAPESVFLSAGDYSYSPLKNQFYIVE